MSTDPRHHAVPSGPSDADVTPTGPPAAPVIDWQALADSLRAPPAFLEKLARTMVSNLGPKPQALRAAAALADLQTIAREAHSIKGVAANVHAQLVFDIARSTESAAREGSPEAGSLAQALAVSVESMLASAQDRLDR